MKGRTTRRLSCEYGLLLGACLVVAASCSEGAGSTSATDAADSDAGPVWLVDEAVERGVDFQWESGHAERHYFPEIIGGGAALLDAEDDGDLDLYLVQAGGVELPPAERPGNRLLLNDEGVFQDASEGSGADDRGYGMGVAAGDCDDDGRTDLYVTNVDANALLRNLGHGRFEAVTGEAGVGDESWSVSAGFLDHDRDGDLDLFVVNYVRWSPADELNCYSKPHPEDYCSPKAYEAPAPDTLYENRGDGSFRDVSSSAGIRAAFGNGLGIVCSDFDDDGWEDVFVANDGMLNQLWMNTGDGRFEDAAIARGCAADQDGREKAGMGTAAADVDGDGDEDLLVVNLAGETDSFFRNDGQLFSDRTPLVGLSAASRPFTRFGTGFIDFDNDGVLDLYQANGRVTRAPEAIGPRPFDEVNLLFRGSHEEGRFRFREVTPRDAHAATSRAAVFGDLNGDGGMDVVVVNRDGPLNLLINEAPVRGSWIGFKVREESGRDALGALLTVRMGDRAVIRRVRSAYSYCAANDPRVHLGLGEAAIVESVEVRWVDGTEEGFGRFEAGSYHELRRGAGVR